MQYHALRWGSEVYGGRALQREPFDPATANEHAVAAVVDKDPPVGREFQCRLAP